MKEAERRRKRLEQEKKLTESSNNASKKIINSIQTDNSKNIINNEDINQNQNAIQKRKERRERRKQKNKTNNNEPSIDNNNKIEKDNMQSEYQNNNNNSISTNKKLNNENNQKIISDNISEYSINNNLDNSKSLSSPNYRFLSKNYNEIKLENIKNFLNKTNAEKPSNEQKEYEIKKMIKIMELKPKKLDISNKDVEDTFAVNLIEKMEGNEEYQEKQNEIKNLKKKIKEEENQIEQTLEKNKEEIKKYVENIMKLQNNLINSQKGDIFYLEEENKIDEIKIQNLRATHRRLIEENKEEKDRINKIINEQIPIYTKELEKEIEEVKKMKHQLEIIGKKKPPNDIMKKIEVVMRYKKK